MEIMKFTSVSVTMNDSFGMKFRSSSCMQQMINDDETLKSFEFAK
jgi:hypothetical protein